MKRAYWDPTIASRYPILSRLSSRFRARRAAEFIKRLNVDANKRILDVGGEPYFWESFPVQCGVVCLNLHSMVSRSPRIAVETYDGMRLPYDDKAFDIVFSNSVIEHVGDFNAQRLFAREISRVGRHYWVQVPNFFFPYEPHAHLPFFQFLPANTKLWILQWWRRAGYGIDDMLSVRLLTARELRYFFPGCAIYRERFFGLTKSLCAYTGGDATNAQPYPVASATVA